jgi:hypothetical protein
MSDITLKCNCGKVRGVARDVSPESGNRIVCYCSDCRAFALHLASDKRFLDQYGGTDNYQMPTANFKISRGIEHVRCLRLTEKGMFRWYTDCCKTPIGNTMSAGVPYVSLSVDFIEDKASIDSNLGPVRGYLKTSSATSRVLAGRTGFAAFKTVVRAIYKLLIWKIKGLNKPNALFDNSGKPISEPLILKK